MCSKCAVAVVQARHLIGDQKGDITGATLDAWVVLSEAETRCGDDTQWAEGFTEGYLAGQPAVPADTTGETK